MFLGGVCLKATSYFPLEVRRGWSHVLVSDVNCFRRPLCTERFEQNVILEKLSQLEAGAGVARKWPSSKMRSSSLRGNRQGGRNYCRKSMLDWRCEQRIRRWKQPLQSFGSRSSGGTVSTYFVSLCHISIFMFGGYETSTKKLLSVTKSKKRKLTLSCG